MRIDRGEEIEIRRRVGNWTAKVELKRFISRHNDTTTVDEVTLHLSSTTSAIPVSELLREAARVFKKAAIEAEELMNAVPDVLPRESEHGLADT